MAATATNKGRVQSQLEPVSPLGGTDHMLALREALKLKPEVIFFLTDAELISNSDIDEILTEVGATRIQAVEFGFGMSLGQRTPLSRLATTTGGTYRYIDVSKFATVGRGLLNAENGALGPHLTAALPRLSKRLLRFMREIRSDSVECWRCQVRSG